MEAEDDFGVVNVFGELFEGGIGVRLLAEGELSASGDLDALEGVAEFLSIGAEFARDAGDEDAARLHVLMFQGSTNSLA
jgi:hypothetical protein